MGTTRRAYFGVRHDVRDELRRIGVDMAQGYLIHKPQPLAALLSNGSQMAQPFMTSEGFGDIMTRVRRLTEIPVDGSNPNCLDINNTADVMLWADDLGISIERLHEIVDKVGPMRAAIKFYANASKKVAEKA